MQNPWISLPDNKPFVLEADRPELERIGIKQFDLDVLPEPFLGDVKNAPVMLLSANPGAIESDKSWHNDLEFKKASLKNLCHETKSIYLLDKRFEKSGGYKWWHAKLRQLIESCGIDSVSRNISVVEYLGYHSTTYPARKLILPSQEYALNLVNETMKDGRLIVIIRKVRKWTENVPKLADYPYLMKLNSPQSGCISPGNMKQKDFDKIVAKLVI